MLISSRNKIPKNFVQNTAITVIIDLNRCIDPANGFKFKSAAIHLMGDYLHRLSCFQVIIHMNIECFRAIKA